MWTGEDTVPPGETQELVEVWYDEANGRLHFDYIVPGGFEIREDGVGALWSGEPSDGSVTRVEFTPQRARFLTFKRSTGAFHGESALVPLPPDECLGPN